MHTFRVTFLALVATCVSAWPASPLMAPQLQPYTVEEQTRMRAQYPPIMDGHYKRPSPPPSDECPRNLVPDVFPWAKIDLPAATSYCSKAIATATSTSTLHTTLTAWVMPDATLPPIAPLPTVDSYAYVHRHAASHGAASVSAACTCLVGRPTGPLVVTKTVFAPVETHTAI